MHWLNDCTKATDAEKVELRNSFRAAKQKKEAGLKRLSKVLPVADRRDLKWCAGATLLS
eukprot:jgi/Phyca11/110928/e_gw1.19.609.1